MKSQNEFTGPDRPSSSDDASDRKSSALTPRWVKLRGIIFILGAITVVIVHLKTGGFRHPSTPQVKEPAAQPP